MILTLIAVLIGLVIIYCGEFMPDRQCDHKQMQVHGRRGFCAPCKSHFKLDRCDAGPMFWTYTTSPRKSDVWVI